MEFNSKYLVLIALFAAGCGGGGYNGGGNDNGSPPDGASFTSFVKDQIAKTSDTSEPIEVNDRQFQFDDNETAFDDVLQQ